MMVCLCYCVAYYAQEKLKERRLKAEMERELEEKDRRVNELLIREQEVSVCYQYCNCIIPTRPLNCHAGQDCFYIHCRNKHDFSGLGYLDADGPNEYIRRHRHKARLWVCVQRSIIILHL